jgi:hypothetical protein
MGIIKIEREDYSALRVARNIDGKTHVRYFTLRVPGKDGRRKRAKGEDLARITAEAKAYDAELAERQKAARLKVRQAAVPRRSSNNTGVSGINYVSTTWVARHEKFYEWPSFVVNVTDTNGKVIGRKVRIYEGEEKAAWKRAVESLAEAKGIEVGPLVKRFPAHLFSGAKARPAKKAAKKK